VQGDGGPVDIPYDQTTAGTQGAEYLGERGRNLGDILEHLHRQCGVEARVLDWQRGGVRLVEFDVVPLGAMRRHLEHRLAAVDADNRAVGSHALEQLGDVEPRSAAHVQDAFAGGRAEGVVDQLPAPQHVARAIEHFELSGGALIEFQLTLPLIASSRDLTGGETRLNTGNHSP
jgi:hypothetical protein